MNEKNLIGLIKDNVFIVSDIRVGNENVIILTLKNESEEDSTVTSRIVDLRDISQFSYGALVDEAIKVDHLSKYGVQNPWGCWGNNDNIQPKFLGFVVIKFDPSLGREDNKKYMFTSKELYGNFIRFLQYEPLVDHTQFKNDLKKMTTTNNSKFIYLPYNISNPDRGVWLNFNSIVFIDILTDPLLTDKISVRITANIESNEGWPYKFVVEGFKLRSEAISFIKEDLLKN